MRHAALPLTSVFLFGSLLLVLWLLRLRQKYSLWKGRQMKPGQLCPTLPSSWMSDGRRVWAYPHEKTGKRKPNARPSTRPTKWPAWPGSGKRQAIERQLWCQISLRQQLDVASWHEGGRAEIIWKTFCILFMLMSHNNDSSGSHIWENILARKALLGWWMKKQKIGCTDTYLLRPTVWMQMKRRHHTTARWDLALIMRYAIRSETFKDHPDRNIRLQILMKKRIFCSQYKRSAMTDGVLSGKTGFTGDAGYCYVPAKRWKDLSLLGCGWPNNKGAYKWKDSSVWLCLKYGLQVIWLQWEVLERTEVSEVPVKDWVEKHYLWGHGCCKRDSVCSEKEKNKNTYEKGEISCRPEMPESFRRR